MGLVPPGTRLPASDPRAPSWDDTDPPNRALYARHMEAYAAMLDNADQKNVTDGYYAVTEFSGEGAQAILHVITYKAMSGQPPDIVRFDYRWSDVK